MTLTSDDIKNILFGVAAIVGPAFSAWQSWEAKREAGKASEHAQAATAAIAAVKTDVATIVVATNGMQEKLLAATATIGEAKGRADEKAEHRADFPKV